MPSRWDEGASSENILTLCAALECSLTPPKNAAVASLPICLRMSARPPGWKSIKSVTSCTKPEITMRSLVWLSFWTVNCVKDFVKIRSVKDIQVSQSTIGSCSEVDGQLMSSWAFLSRLSCMDNSPFLISFSGKTRKLVARLRRRQE